MNEERFFSTTQEKQKIKAKIREYFESKTEISFGYFFGSFLGNDSYADIDLGVFFDSGISKDDYLNLTLKYSLDLSLLVGFPVEVHALNNASLEFQFQATKGEILFSRDEDERCSFWEEIWPRYFDFQYFIRENLNDLLK